MEACAVIRLAANVFRPLYLVRILFYKNDDWISYTWNLDGTDFTKTAFFEASNSSCEL